MSKTVTIRILETTRKRLKLKAVKEEKTLIQVIDDLSKI